MTGGCGWDDMTHWTCKNLIADMYL
jgi:hypothetical protein